MLQAPFAEASTFARNSRAGNASCVPGARFRCPWISRRNLRAPRRRDVGDGPEGFEIRLDLASGNIPRLQVGHEALHRDVLEPVAPPTAEAMRAQVVLGHLPAGVQRLAVDEGDFFARPPSPVSRTRPWMFWPKSTTWFPPARRVMDVGAGSSTGPTTPPTNVSSSPKWSSRGPESGSCDVCGLFSDESSPRAFKPWRERNWAWHH